MLPKPDISTLPYLDKCTLAETDMKEGLLSMLNKGKIPKGVDLSEAFMGKGQPIF